MFDLSVLRVPVIAAPMAGGPSTPELVAAVASAGAFGFLAAGYKTVEAVRADIDALRDLSSAPFGLNVFVPGEPLGDTTEVEAYRDRLSERADRLDEALPEIVAADDDAYSAKLDLAVEEAVPVVSFTFGLPSSAVVDRLHTAGSFLMASVSDVAEAVRAAATGVDAICVQGAGAGGHRATLDPWAEPNAEATPELVAAVAARIDVPIVAAGAIATGQDVDAALAAGATAVQIGTALLDAEEAGTKAAHRAALHDEQFGETVVTRAFSGRPARGLRNAFVDELDAFAVPAYPQVNGLTSGLRAAADRAGDPHGLALWAGLRYREARHLPAAEIVRGLLTAVH